MSRVGLVTALLPPSLGGTEVLVWRLFKDAPDTVVVSGVESPSRHVSTEDYGALVAPTLFVPYPKLRGYRYGLALLLGAYSGAWLLRAVGRTVRFLSEQAVERIVSIPHNGPFALVGLLAARRMGIPHTFYILDAWEDAATGSVERQFIRIGLKFAARMPGSHLAAVSPALAAHYRDSFGFANCSWIPNPGPLEQELPERDIQPRPIAVLSGGIKPFNTVAIRSLVRAIRRCAVVQKIVVTGPTFGYSETLRSTGELHDRVEFRLASRTEVADLQRQAAVLVVATNVDDASSTSRGYLPGRLPEYVAARRPILLVGPDGSDASRAIRHWQLGRTLATHDEGAIAEALDCLAAETMKWPPTAPRRRETDLFLEVFSRTEARRRLLGEESPPLSDAAADLAKTFELPFGLL